MGEEIWQRTAARLGVDANVGRPVYTTRDHFAYWQWKFSRLWLQPASVFASVFAVIFGGWIATVNASFDSVPGDTLYPVKLATERVQITLATSGEQRAKLHAEFAGRRLDEVDAIVGSSLDGKEVRVQAAMDGFRQEIASVNTELTAVADADPEEALSLAIVLDQKTEAYVSAIEQAAPAVPAESQTQVAEALTAAEESNAQALNAIVQSHEANQEPSTAETLQKKFQDGLNDLETRVALSLGRLQVIENALAAKGMGDAAYADRIRAAREVAAVHDRSIQDAMEVFAAGGYRSAFDRLSEIEAQVVASEQIVTELEIEITTGI
jgi:hypothetical protein